VAAKTASGSSHDGILSQVWALVAPSPLAIIRNHQQAIAAIGGTTVWEDVRYTTLKVSKDGKEIWAQVDTAWQRGYVLIIVEKQAMVQDVTANAELFKAGLKTTGHVEVPGIFFDTAKADLKPESDAALGECAKLLAGSPKLAVYVVGHTDNQGGLASNMSLSAARADAVVKALVARFKVDAARLARESVALTVNQYKAGTVGYLNVVQVQATQLNEERQTVALMGRRLAATVGLIRALGGSW